MTSTPRPVAVLCGPPGAGKTTVGTILARLLGTEFRDSDHEVERAAGRTVPEIFAAEGESGFRAIERATIARLLSEFDGVLALGGGAVLDPATRADLAGLDVVLLDVGPEESVARVARSGERPLLEGDPVAKVTALMEQRRAVYEEVATLRIDTVGTPPEDVAARIADRLGAAAPATRIPVTGAAPYEVLVGRGLVDDVAALVGEGSTRVVVLHAPPVARYAEAIRERIAREGVEATAHALPDGEHAKTVAVAAELWDLLGELRLGREDTIVAVGGGATTDLAGWVAAAWLRGVRLVNVPTTLLAMVDASVGGKTGVNTPAGKNLVGAFHTPAGVVCDLDLLATLPEADYRAGLGEVVKCGFIADEEILRLVEADEGAGALDRGSRVVRELVERSIAVKARVVTEDLRETGLRETLNYGHTFGHAVEAVEDFGVRHGEAVAIGMVFAGELATRETGLDPEVVARTRRDLALVGLPTGYRGGRWPELLAAMRHDKKVRGGALRFVVLDGVARTATLRGPSDANLEAAYAAVSEGEAP